MKTIQILYLHEDMGKTEEEKDVWKKTTSLMTSVDNIATATQK
jgi:hypothetical protein